MYTKLGILTFCVVGIVIGLIALVITSREDAPVAQKTTPPTGELKRYNYEASYEELTRRQMITQSDAIFVGQVQEISPARWNQDSGEYVADERCSQLLYDDIEVQVVWPIVDDLGLDDIVTITVLGNSPVGSIASSPEILPDPEHTLQTGDQYIFFVVKRYIAWRNDLTGPEGTRLTIRFITAPSISHLKRVDDNTGTNNRLDDETLFVAEDPNEKLLSIADILHLREFPKPTPIIIATDNQ